MVERTTYSLCMQVREASVQVTCSLGETKTAEYKMLRELQVMEQWSDGGMEAGVERAVVL